MTGLSAVIGSWKIIDMRVQRSSRSRVSPAASTFRPRQDSPERRLQGLGQEAHDGEGDHRLPEPDFAHQADDLAGIDREAHFSTAWTAVGASRQGQRLRLRTSRTGFFHSSDTPSSRPRREARDGGPCFNDFALWRGEKTLDGVYPKNEGCRSARSMTLAS